MHPEDEKPTPQSDLSNAPVYSQCGCNKCGHMAGIDLFVRAGDCCPKCGSKDFWKQ